MSHALESPVNPLLTSQEAERLIDDHLSCLSSETRALSLCVSRVLREDVFAERDNPPFDRVCMDGIAVSSAALRQGQRRFNVLDTQAAGSPALRLSAPDSAIEVMTGAIMPLDADCIVPLEQYLLADNVATLQADVVTKPHHNVQLRGADGPRGVLMLRSGTVLGAPEIAVAASAGKSHLQVSSQPAFMVISTGNELVEPGEPIASHQVRRSNAYAVVAALRSRGFDRLADDHIADDEAQLRSRLRLHLETYDVVILSGGVSMGRFDLVPKALAALGVREIFHRVAQRPGKPMWFGVGPRGQAVFGLPGNPVSTLVCLVRYIIPAITSAMGAPRRPDARLALSAPVTFNLPLTLFLPVTIEHDGWGRPWASPRPTNTSGDYLALAGTDGFVELPPGPNTYDKGFVANIYRW